MGVLLVTDCLRATLAFVFMVAYLFPSTRSESISTLLLVAYLFCILSLFPSATVINQVIHDPTRYLRVLAVSLLRLLPGALLLFLILASVSQSSAGDLAYVIAATFFAFTEFLTGFALLNYFIDRKLIYFVRLSLHRQRNSRRRLNTKD